MLDMNCTILYVEDMGRSVQFYTRLLALEPVEFSPVLAMFFQESGARLALWSRASVEPEPTPSSGFELAFALSQDSDVDDLYAQWVALGIPIILEPWRSAAAYNFLAVDPDGHRLRSTGPSP